MLSASEHDHARSSAFAQSMLSLHFVKPGVLAKDTASKLNQLMAMRHAADYKGEVIIDAGEVDEYRPWTIGFVGSALDILRQADAMEKVLRPLVMP